jgi:hypothetical protein
MKLTLTLGENDWNFILSAKLILMWN